MIKRTNKKCDVADGECIGSISETDHTDQPLTLCQFHERELCEIGEDGFREWYSNELAA